MSATTNVRYGLSPVRILVADADSETRSFYRESLRRAGCDVVDAENGPDALVQALGQRPALVITDTRLPVFDGYALCEVLRRDSMTRTVPILIVTTESHQGELDRLRAVGADAILFKPVARHVLLTEIRRLLGRAAKPARKEVTPESASVQSTCAAAEASDLRRRRPLTRAHLYSDPPARLVSPPDVVCPSCDRPLTYECSHVGGITGRHSEQWDDYTCPGSCGTFQYRQRTGHLRRVEDSELRNGVTVDCAASAAGAARPERRRYRADTQLRRQREQLEHQWNERQRRRRAHATMFANGQET